jgi:hypothetical protein
LKLNGNDLNGFEGANALPEMLDQKADAIDFWIPRK